MRQKLDYLHDNPVKRGLVAELEHGRYSRRMSGWRERPVMTCDRWIWIEVAKHSFADRLRSQVQLGNEGAAALA